MKKTLICISLLAMVACSNRANRVEKAELHFRAAQQLYLKQELTQALAEGLKAEKADKKNAEVQNFLGIIYGQMGDYDMARQHMNRAVDIEPEYAEAHTNLCGFYISEADYDKAKHHCQKAVEVVTYNNAERAYYNLGLIAEKQDDPATAMKMYLKSLVHNKNFVLSIQSLGNMYYNESNFEEAEELLTRGAEACDASPKGAWGIACGDIQYHLALTSFQLKKPKQGVTALKHCVEQDVKNRFKTKCENSLQLYR